MQLKLSINEDVNLTNSEKNQIDKLVDQIISIHKNNSNIIEGLVLESTTALTMATARTNELSEQGTCKRLWNDFVGKNKGLSNEINRNFATSQYASQQMIQKLAEQNLMSMEFSVQLNQKLNMLTINLQDSLLETNEKVYRFAQSIIKLTEQIKDDTSKNSAEIRRINDLLSRFGYVCPNCGGKIKREQSICYQCGEIQEIPIIDSDINKQKFLQKITKLLDVIKQNAISNEYKWDPTVAEYARKMEKTKAVLTSDIFINSITEKTIQDIDAFLKQCKDSEFQIAVVGTVKAGKSTLINSLLGFELASMDITPETSALTKFRSSKNGSYVNVSFYSKAEWADLWKSVNKNSKKFREEYNKLGADSQENIWVGRKTEFIKCNSNESLRLEIEKWTTSGAPAHFFVKEVEVGVEGFNLPEQIVFVDTPGLSDPVKYRSDITRAYISSANAVLACILPKNLNSNELSMINRIIVNTNGCPQKVYVIATQLDTLNYPIKEEWGKQKKLWVELLKPIFSNSEILTSKNLIAVSAYLQLMLIKADGDNSIELQDDFIKKFKRTLYAFDIELEDWKAKYEDLVGHAGIKDLINRLNTDIFSKYKALLVADINKNYNLLNKEISKLMLRIEFSQNDVISTSKKGIDEIKKEKSKKDEEIEEIKLEKIDLDNKITFIKKVNEEFIKTLAGQIENLKGGI